LGARPISTFSDALSVNVGLEQIYKVTRNAEIMNYVWHFASREAELTPVGDNPNRFSDRFDYEYYLPVDCLRPAGLDSNREYVLDGGKLYTNDGTATLLFVSLPDDSYFPAHFVRALSWRVAEALAIAIAGKASLGEYCGKRADKYFAEARSVDAMSATNQDISIRIEEMLAQPPHMRP